MKLSTSLDSDSIRADFPFFQNIAPGKKPLIYLDNASTSQKPGQVIDAVTTYYREFCANVHRGVYGISEQATDAYETARKKAADFIRATDPRSIVFTSGTTESINLIAYAWGRYNLKPGDEILITEMEHHSNIIPWQLAARDTGATLRYIPITMDGILDLKDVEKYFTSKTKLVGMIHQSNVFGTVNPIKDLIRSAKNVGAVTLVDAAQSVPHTQVDVKDLDCDFFTFSGHKMLGPTSVGVLFGKPELLEAMEPFQGGGEMINSVTMEKSTWNDIPYKFEAGTPNIAQAIGLGAAIDYLTRVGMNRIQRYEQDLLSYAMQALKSINGITVYGSDHNRGPVISFNIDRIHPFDLAKFLDQDGIAIRAGHHCAQPIMHKLGISATARASFYLYNTREEIDTLRNSIENIKQLF